MGVAGLRSACPYSHHFPAQWGLTAMQGSLGRPRSRHGSSGPVPAVSDRSDEMEHFGWFSAAVDTKPSFPVMIAPQNTGRRAHSIVEERTCTRDRAEARHTQPAHRRRPPGTAAAARLKTGCRWDRADAHHAQQQEGTLPHGKAKAAGLNAPPDHRSHCQGPSTSADSEPPWRRNAHSG
jgi:hypothetical protein